MSRLKTKLLILTCILCSLTTPILANTPNTDLSVVAPTGRVTELNLGQRAPFKGLLFSEDAAAGLFANLKLTDSECRLRLRRELDINAIMFNSQIEALNLRLGIETERSSVILEIKNERIQFLEENWETPDWYEAGEFWFAVGTVVGITLTVVSAYALGQAAK